MNPEIKAKLVAALRSGKYHQATGKLRSGNGFCCLGVLCDVYSKERGEGWDREAFLGNESCLPAPVYRWAGISCGEAPHDPIIQGKHLSEYNDNGTTFRQIADLIEAHL